MLLRVLLVAGLLLLAASSTPRGVVALVLSCVLQDVLRKIDDAPGTAFLAAEGSHGGCGVSVWAYLYGDDAPALIERDKPRWQAWLQEHAD